ncbi:MFS family permease [Streptacidiphilus sp. MAP12-16]|uniref:MFS transporter n=1 Tax=Streptacidiphilus sp. MAP12-16 TaxID=3156300 RepID=UPI003518F88F
MPPINKSAVSVASPPPISESAWSPARIALTAFFAMDGFLFAGWVVRIPAIKAEVHASAGQLGLALLCVSAGAVAVMAPVSRLCLRFGNHPVTVAAAVLLCAAVALPAQVHSVLGLGGVLLLFGAGYGAVNVGINSAAVDLVAAAGRPVMPAFHAAYSLGGLIGAGLGGLLATVLTPAQHLGLIAVFGLAVTAAAGLPLLRHRVVPPQEVEAETPKQATPTTATPTTATPTAVVRGPLLLVLLLGLVALCDAYGEGALADWGTLHLSADLHATASVAAAGFAAYSLAMTTGRLGGTRLVERFGPTRVLVTGAGVACGGMLVAALSPWLPLALAGFLLVGLGLANIFPLAIDRAGALNGPKGVATASMLGYGGMVLGPPIIGFLAQGVGLPSALLSVALLAGLAGVAALAVQRAADRT